MNFFKFIKIGFSKFFNRMMGKNSFILQFLFITVLFALFFFAITLHYWVSNQIENKRAQKFFENCCAGNNGLVVEALAKNPRLINAASDNGWTPLMYATRYGHKETVELLIKNGAYLGATNKNGKTALTIAIEYKEKEIEEILIRKSIRKPEKNVSDIPESEINLDDYYGKCGFEESTPKNDKILDDLKDFY